MLVENSGDKVEKEYGPVAFHNQGTLWLKDVRVWALLQTILGVNPTDAI
jgi:hypothetical protein